MSVRHDVVAMETEIRVQTSRIARQTHQIFTHFTQSYDNNNDVIHQSQSHNDVTRETEASSRTFSGSIIVPHKCAVHHGKGEFLFLGRIRLGRAFLKCAPRLDDFKRLWHSATKTGHNPCVIDDLL